MCEWIILEGDDSTGQNPGDNCNVDEPYLNVKCRICDKPFCYNHFDDHAQVEAANGTN